MKYITGKCTSVSGGLVEEMGRQLFPIKVYLFVYSTNFFYLLINLFAYFVLLYRYAFFLTNKGKYYQKKKKKPLHLFIETSISKHDTSDICTSLMK